MRDSETKFLRGVLEENRESLKWLWLIVMAFSMESAVDNFYESFADLSDRTADVPLLSAIILPPSEAASFLVLFATGLLFLLTFTRYILGGSRYIELRFLEIDLAIEAGGNGALDKELRRFSDWRSFCDVMLLILHGILFLFLANSIGNFDYFVQTYLFILIANIIWLVISLFPVLSSTAAPANPSRFDALREGVGLLRRDTAPRWWLFINTLTFLFLSNAMYVYPWKENDNFVYACLIIILSNTVADLGATWRFYFPSLKRKRRIEHRTPKAA